MQQTRAIVARICPDRAADVDDLLAPHDGRSRTAGREIYPPLDGALLPEPRFEREDAICIGYRVTGELADAPDRAMRLAAMAYERDVEVVVLSETDVSGLERFGFRSERVPPNGPEHDAWLDQIRRFWGLDLVL